MIIDTLLTFLNSCIDHISQFVLESIHLFFFLIDHLSLQFLFGLTRNNKQSLYEIDPS